MLHKGLIIVSVDQLAKNTMLNFIPNHNIIEIFSFRTYSHSHSIKTLHVVSKDDSISYINLNIFWSVLSLDSLSHQAIMILLFFFSLTKLSYLLIVFFSQIQIVSFLIKKKNNNEHNAT